MQTSVRQLKARASGTAKGALSIEATDPAGAREKFRQAGELFRQAAELETDPREQRSLQGLADMYLSKSKKRVAISESYEEAEGPERTASDFLLSEIPAVSFADIGGLEEVKQNITEAIIEPFLHPDIYEYYGKRTGGRVLLYGPPGCGKTLMAKAAAHECGAVFLQVRTSSIMSRYVGESEKNIKAVFEAAREAEQDGGKVIIFFDEIDSIAGRRSQSEDYVKRIVNELLTQLDGVDTADDSFLVLAATNIPWAIDPALRRPGRFGKMVLIPSPDDVARREILKINLQKLPVSPGVSLDVLARKTAGFSGADLKSIIEEAADIPLSEALKSGRRREITMQDFEEVLAKKRSSVSAWLTEARREIQKVGEEDVFKELF